MEGDKELADLKRMLGHGQYTDMAPKAWKDADMGRSGGPLMSDRVPAPRKNTLMSDKAKAPKNKLLTEADDLLMGRQQR